MAGSLEGVLAGIPGLAGYLASRQNSEQQQSQELQQAGALTSLVAQIKKQQQQQGWQQQVQGLGPDATHEQMVNLAVKSGLMDPNQLATLAQGAENKKLQVEATKQTALSRLAQQATLAQRTHEYRMSSLSNAQDRTAEIERHNLENEDINRESVRLTGQRLNLSAANTAFQQANTAANTNYNTGATVAPTVNATTVSAPVGNRTPVSLTPAEQQQDAATDSSPGNIAELQAAIAAERRPEARKMLVDELARIQSGATSTAQAPSETMPVSAPAPRNNLDARDLMLRNGGSTSPSASPVAAPSQAPVVAGAIPPMPPEIARLPKKVQDEWVKQQAKVNVNLAGGRESVFINRVILAGNEAAADLANVVKLPMTASRGLFGGRGQSEGIFNAGKETLTNAMTTQEVQTYNVLATGFQRSLAAIEAAGLAPQGALMHQMDAVIFKEGDTNFTKLMKLAQTRQIVEKGLETTMTNPRVPQETKTHMKEILEKVVKSVPFTPSDLLELQDKQLINPNVTLGDVMKAKGAPANGWSIRPK